MAIAPGSGTDRNGTDKNGSSSKSQKKSAPKRRKKPPSKSERFLGKGTVWIGDATACLNQVQHRLKEQEKNSQPHGVITPSPQAARAL
mgnify:FL=1